MPICSEPKCGSRGTAREGIHQLSDYFWLCGNCYQQRKDEQFRRKLDRTLLDWSHKESVDNLDEAMNYFAWLQSNRQYSSFFKMRAIRGSLGFISYVLELAVEQNGFFDTWQKKYCYYLCYNREYLQGYKAANAFERVPKHYFSGPWQTFHWHIVEDALSNWKKYEGRVCMVLVNKTKIVYYIDPVQLHKWATEYECQRIPPYETLLECSIPVSKMSEVDPFI